MLSTIKGILKDTAAAQGLNFEFLSLKEINSGLEDVDLNVTTIIVNSSIEANHIKTQGMNIDQKYDVHIICIQKREVEDSDESVFDEVIAPIESPFLTYLTAVSESTKLYTGLGPFKIETLYFGSGNPIAGLQSKIKLSTFCIQ